MIFAAVLCCCLGLLFAPFSSAHVIVDDDLDTIWPYDVSTVTPVEDHQNECLLAFAARSLEGVLTAHLMLLQTTESVDWPSFFRERTHDIKGVNRLVDVLRPEINTEEVPMFSDLITPEFPPLLEYNFRLMDEFDQDLLDEYMRWLETRGEALKEDVVYIFTKLIGICQDIRKKACVYGTDVPHLYTNECRSAKGARILEGVLRAESILLKTASALKVQEFVWNQTAALRFETTKNPDTAGMTAPQPRLVQVLGPLAETISTFSDLLNLGPPPSKPVQYNFRLMDAYDQEYFDEYLVWIQNRGASLKDDILEVILGAIQATKRLQSDVCSYA